MSSPIGTVIVNTIVVAMRANKLHWLMEERVPPDDEDGQTVFPDIIVHRRRTTENLPASIEKCKFAADSRGRV